MKKYFKTLSVLLAVAGLASCTSQEDFKGPDQNVEKVEMTFSASVENSQTRTVLRNGRDVEFVAGDQLWVFDGKSSEPNRFRNSANNLNKFEGSAYANAASYYAVYCGNGNQPYMEGNDIFTTIPSIQTATANSFDPNANISVAKTEDNQFRLMNIGALLKFRVPEGVTYNYAQLFSAEDENGSFIPLSGEVSVSLDGDLTCRDGNSPSSWVELNGEITGGNTYYMVVRPGTYNDLRFELHAENTDAFDVTKQVSEKITFERSRVYDLGEMAADIDRVDEGMRFEMATTYDSSDPVRYIFTPTRTNYYTFLGLVNGDCLGFDSGYPKGRNETGYWMEEGRSYVFYCINKNGSVNSREIAIVRNEQIGDLNLGNNDNIYCNTTTTDGALAECRTYTFGVPQNGYYQISVPEFCNITVSCNYYDINCSNISTECNFYAEIGQAYRVTFYGSENRNLNVNLSLTEPHILFSELTHVESRMYYTNAETSNCGLYRVIGNASFRNMINWNNCNGILYSFNSDMKIPVLIQTKSEGELSIIPINIEEVPVIVPGGDTRSVKAGEVYRLEIPESRRYRIEGNGIYLRFGNSIWNFSGTKYPYIESNKITYVVIRNDCEFTFDFN